MKTQVKNYFEDNSYYVELYFPRLNKTYVGKCKLHDEDKETALRFKGYEIAENRAWIKYFKEQKKEIKLKKKTLEDFIGSFGSNCNYDATNYIARKLRKQIYLYSKEISEIETAINELEEDILFMIHPEKTLEKLSKSIATFGASSVSMSEALKNLNEALGQSQLK